MSRAQTPITPFTTEQVLRRERRLLRLKPSEQPSALCLSGGGVRSAAFCLGVLQALARRGLLEQFHYLSTVSGGGYIASWLTRAIASQCDDPAAAGRPASVAQAEADIAGPESDRPGGRVHALRRFTSFLAPEPGLLSLDTLTGILLWLRNTLITWFVLLPIFVALVGVPLVYVALTAALIPATADASCKLATDAGLRGPADACFNGAADFVLLAAGGAGLFAAACFSILGVPSHSHPDRPASEIKPGDPAQTFGPDAGQVRWRIILPILLWCFAVPMAAAPRIFSDHHTAPLHDVFGTRPKPACAAAPAACPAGATDDSALVAAAAHAASRALVEARAACPAVPEPAVCVPPIAETRTWTDLEFAFLPLLGLAACLFAYGIAFAWEASRPYRTGDAEMDKKAYHWHVKLFRKGFLPWVTSALVSAGLLWWGIWAAKDLDIYWLALAGPLWVALAEALRTTVFVALRRAGLRSDLDREWLARLNGTKLVVVLAACLLGVVVVIGGSHLTAWTDKGIAALAGGGVASGGLVAWLGRSAMTAFAARGPEAKGRQVPLALLTNLGIVLFGGALLVLIGHGTAVGIGRIALLWPAGPDQPLAMRPIATVAILLTLGAAGLAFWLGSLINLNRFSMHAVYRSRLIRGFLGSARRPADKRPDRFTGFDPLDNLRVRDAFARRAPRRLFPVINVALNRTKGFDPAYAARKADSFTITPMHCGSAQLGRRPAGATKDPAKDPIKGAYVRTKIYAGEERQTGLDDRKKGISLGTAMTISGAAASPNMGYHSSALTAFVMTLFNVRLGAWLPNPGAGLIPRDMRRGGPRNAVRALLSELTGRSRDDGDFVYLSDGGHFDNLGLYEMLRRRCDLIVAVDAGQDADYGYEDLGRALQFAAIDLGIAVTFAPPIKAKEKALAQIGALAWISYPARDGLPAAEGRLVFLKPYLPDDLPITIAAGKVRREAFPHEPTLNQFFTESDFENYRGLGETLTEALFTAAGLDGTDRIDLRDLFGRLEEESKKA
ncbi:patatin-like phospholipase family protein [Methylobacterium sp. A54F]